MASAGLALRNHLEGLMLGTSGTGYVMEANRFHLCSPDVGIERHPFDSIERAIDIETLSAEPFVERNPFDGFDYVRCNVQVNIGYALTNAGGDNAEGLTEQNGEGTLNSINDRAVTDYLDVVRVLTWPDNRGSISPTIIAIIAEDGYELEPLEDRFVLRIPLRIDTVASTLSAFAP